MQISVESGEGLERRMTVELPAERVNQEVEKRLQRLAKTARIDGFRPGKVPLSVVRKRYAEQVRGEVFGELVQSSYFEALNSQKLLPAGTPSIKPVEKNPEEGLAYTAVFEVMPEVTLNSMDGVSVDRPVVEVTEADVQAMIDKLRRQRVTWSRVERAAQEGDQVTINFKGSIDGEPFPGGTADDVPLVLGSHSMIEGFEEGLVGAGAGEKRTLKLKFPKDYRAQQLAGKETTFEVEVTAVAEPVLPEVDEVFIKTFGVSEGGVEAFQQEIRANMEREVEDKVRAVLKKQVMDALLEVNPIEVPKVMVRQEAEAMRDHSKAALAQRGQAGNMELPLDLYEDQAKRRVSLGLIVSQVVRDNGIEVDHDRVRARVEASASGYEHPQEVIDYYYSDQHRLAGVQNLVLEEQVVDWVLEQVQVNDQATRFDELLNQPAASN
jgi:trigger factor